MKYIGEIFFFGPLFLLEDMIKLLVCFVLGLRGFFLEKVGGSDFYMGPIIFVNT